jgi:tetratricopeptide (TPR) repeat protein
MLLAGAAVVSLAVVVTMRLYARHPSVEVASAAGPKPAIAAAPPVAGTPPAPRLAPARPIDLAAVTLPAGAVHQRHENGRARPSHRGQLDRLRTCRDALNRDNGRHALEPCRAATAAAPRSATAVIMLAQANYLVGRRQDTLQLARRAVAIDPKLPDAYLLIGSVEHSAGHPRDARAAYESYLRLSPRGRHAAEVRAVLRTL